MPFQCGQYSENKQPKETVPSVRRRFSFSNGHLYTVLGCSHDVKENMLLSLSTSSINTHVYFVYSVIKHDSSFNKCHKICLGIIICIFKIKFCGQKKMAQLELSTVLV